MKKITGLLLISLAMTGCSTGIDAVDQKVNQVKEAANSEVKGKLQEAIQQQVNQLKANSPQFAASLAQNNQVKQQWEILKNTELASQSFFTAFGFEYLARLRGDGTVQVVQRNTGTGEEKIYKEYKVSILGDGQVQVQ